MRESRVRQVAFVTVGGLLLLCSSPTMLSRPRKNGSTDEAGGKRVAVPEFSISVKLSAAAEKRLQHLHEAVLVIAYFDGDPLPGQGKYNPPFRDVFLGSDSNLVDAHDTATFDRTRIPQSDWDRLSNKDYFVTINVVSARRASKNNLLHCGAPEDRISTFAGKATNVLCRLIGERDATTR
jgi:hypothetical protein